MRFNFTPIALLTGTMLMMSTVSFAGPSPTKSATDEGARLLRSVAADARQIAAGAAHLRQLTNNTSATWVDYDRQWNEIQPLVESMNLKIARLEGIQSSLSASEKQALEQSKAESAKIAWYSRELGKLVDQVPANLPSAQFKATSRDLLKEASDVAKVTKI